MILIVAVGFSGVGYASTLAQELQADVILVDDIQKAQIELINDLGNSFELASTKIMLGTIVDYTSVYQRAFYPTPSNPDYVSRMVPTELYRKARDEVA